MSTDGPGLQQILACAAALAGIGGILCVLAASPRRTGLASLVLCAAFAALLAGGVLAFEGSPVADPELSAHLLRGATAGLVLGVLLAMGEARTRERAAKRAQSESETYRREVERLSGTNVRLEDELQDVRRRLTLNERRGEATRSGRDSTGVHQRKALESALSSERKHRAVFEGALEGMAMLERETLRLDTVNPSLVKMTGRDAAELATLTLMDLFTAGDGVPGKADLLRSAREGRPLTVDIQNKDGQVTHADVSIAVIGSGADAQLLTIVRDVSERRMLEQELQQHLTMLQERERGLADANRELAEHASRIEQMNARLSKLQEQKDHFVSTVSHEMRTPLTSIRSFSEILLKHGDAEPEVRREFLEIINKESERLTRLVTNVLDLARIEAGEARLEISEFDLRAVAADAVASMSGMASAKQVAIRRDLGETRRMFCGDRDKIQQLVMNLVSNAVKFSPQARDVTVSVRDAGRSGFTEIVVTDQGPGIPEKDLERIFEKFRQSGDTVPGGVPGTGLGLAIGREIANLHGGRVWAESEKGRGTRLRVELPGLEESRRLLAGHLPVVQPEAPRGALPAETPEPPRSAPAQAVPAPRGAIRGRAAEISALPPLPPRPAGSPSPAPRPTGLRSAGAPPRPAAPAPSAHDWSVTGTLPPLPPEILRKRPDEMSSTGELPPIR